MSPIQVASKRGSSNALPRAIDVALRGEVKWQCHRARLAWLGLQSALQAETIGYDVDVPRGAESAVVAFSLEIWSEVHTILSAAGVVTRILFPRRPRPGLPHDPVARKNAERDRRAFERAQLIWANWPLPPRTTLHALESAAARNAMEHAENGAPEWFASRGEPPLLGYAITRKPAPGKSTGARGAFRLLISDSRIVKIGKDSCQLPLVLDALKRIEDAVPTRAQIDLALPLWPIRNLQDGTQERLNACPLASRPERPPT